MKEEEKAKLKTLFGYWIEHNREHGDEFKEWAGKIKESGRAEIADELMQAAGVIEKATGHLVKASELFGEKE